MQASARETFEASFWPETDIMLVSWAWRYLAMGQKPAPAVNIPIPTTTGSKMGGAPTSQWDPVGFDNHSHLLKIEAPRTQGARNGRLWTPWAIHVRTARAPHCQVALGGCPLPGVGWCRRRLVLGHLVQCLTAIGLDLWTLTFWEIKVFSTKPPKSQTFCRGVKSNQEWV